MKKLNNSQKALFQTNSHQWDPSSELDEAFTAEVLGFADIWFSVSTELEWSEGMVSVLITAAESSPTQSNTSQLRFVAGEDCAAWRTFYITFLSFIVCPMTYR